MRYNTGMEKCLICPRHCNVNREKVKGFCGEQSARVSLVSLHKWEEPIIRGDEKSAGSGTIFFTGCNLKCVYCQNYEISNNGEGKIVTAEDLVGIIKDLERAGANNINFVTPTHNTDTIISALKLYKPKVPVVWNTSGYESEETIEKLKGLVDIFLADLRYCSEELSEKYSSAKDYFKVATKAIKKYRELVGADVIENGLMKKGVIVRVLVLPSHTDDTVKIIDWIYNNLGENQIISIMGQYLPVYRASEFKEINRRITKLEYKRVLNKALECGFKNIYAQELDSASSEYIPDFKSTNKPFGY